MFNLEYYEVFQSSYFPEHLSVNTATLLPEADFAMNIFLQIFKDAPSRCCLENLGTATSEI